MVTPPKVITFPRLPRGPAEVSIRRRCNRREGHRPESDSSESCWNRFTQRIEYWRRFLGVDARHFIHCARKLRASRFAGAANCAVIVSANRRSGHTEPEWRWEVFGLKLQDSARVARADRAWSVYNRLTRLSGSLRFGVSNWSVGSIWGKSGPPTFAPRSQAKVAHRSAERGGGPPPCHPRATVGKPIFNS